MIMETLADFHQKQGKTMVVVTHDSKIANYAGEIVNIKTAK